jgi:SpoVK/Ycf46/Vps4 family AAA+-type ATPase
MDQLLVDLEFTLNEEKETKKLEFKMSAFIEEHVQNWRFVGPAGTGKTSTAQAFALRLHDLGVFGRREAIVVKASEACAGFVGQTALKVAELLAKARGGVLVFDEAYALAPVNGHDIFKKEVVDQLVANLDSDSCKGQMCVILTGYKKEIDELLTCNEGLSRRFVRELYIPQWTPQQCTDYLRSLFNAKGNEAPNLPHELDEIVERCFRDLQGYSHFSSAGDVKDAVFGYVKRIWTNRAKKAVPGQKVCSYKCKLLDAFNISSQIML